MTWGGGAGGGGGEDHVRGTIVCYVSKVTLYALGEERSDEGSRLC